MNLDDKTYLESIDTEGMLGHINNLPEQFETAWQFGLTQQLPRQSFKQVIVCGMGGSAIGGDLLAALIQAGGSLPVTIIRGYDLPVPAMGDETLVIVSSFSGNTEETLSAYHQATERNLPILALTTGGKLAEQARAHQHILWQFDPQAKLMPRAAIGWSLGVLLALAHGVNWLNNLETNVAEAVALMKKYRTIYGMDSAVSDNPAKRQAGQILGRIPVIYGSGVFEVVARRWKTQLNENSKIWAMYEALPESNHNNVVGIEHPADLMTKLITMFIRSEKFDHPRVRLRQKLTMNLFIRNAIAIDAFHTDGESLLAQMMHAILYGDYISLYAAVANQVNPTNIWPINELKTQLSSTLESYK